MKTKRATNANSQNTNLFFLMLVTLFLTYRLCSNELKISYTVILKEPRKLIVKIHVFFNAWHLHSGTLINLSRYEAMKIKRTMKANNQNANLFFLCSGTL